MEQRPPSSAAVIAALIGNTLIATIKFFAFFVSGSGAMLSEGVHSLADTGNQALLLAGLRRAKKKRDEDFPYGYGGERFVFGLLSAAGLFFVGGGVTVYHGIRSLFHHEMPQLGVTTVVVLAVSLVAEGGVLIFTLRRALKTRRGGSIFTHLREKTDPATLAVVLEDSVAVLGVLVAGAGIALSAETNNAIFDAVASIFIGLLLGCVAIFLVRENRELLLGKAVPEEVENKFLEILRGWPSVRAVHDVKTRQITPETFTFKAEIAFHERFLAEKLDRVLTTDALADGGRHEMLCELSRTALTAIGSEIDALEQAVRAAIPEARHIDLEVEHLHRSA